MEKKSKKILICVLILFASLYLKLSFLWTAVAIFVYWKFIDPDEEEPVKKEDINTRMQSTYAPNEEETTPKTESEYKEISSADPKSVLVDALLKYKQKQEEGSVLVDVAPWVKEEEEEQDEQEDVAMDSQKPIQDVDFEEVVDSTDDVVEFDASAYDSPTPNTLEDKEVSSMQDELELLTGCGCISVRKEQIFNLVDLYNEYRMDGKSNGYCPLVVVVDEGLLTTLRLNVAPNAAGTDAVKAAVAAYQERLLRMELEDGKSLLANLLEERKKNSDVWAKVTETPLSSSLDDITDGRGFDFSDFENVYIVKVPVSEPWKIWAYVPYGDCKNCPSVEHQMAVSKYWFDAYGAVPAIVGQGRVAYVLSQLVYYVKEAAMEQYAYCPDILEQSGCTIATLENSIKNDKVWTFRWS